MQTSFLIMKVFATLVTVSSGTNAARSMGGRLQAARTRHCWLTSRAGLKPSLQMFMTTQQRQPPSPGRNLSAGHVLVMQRHAASDDGDVAPSL
jgi:hypothetical protein